MPTYTALTTLETRAGAEALSEAMERLSPAPAGIGLLEVEDGSGLFEVGGYFTEAPDTVALALLATAFDARPFAVSELPDVDWVAHVRRELAPVRAGRFFLYGSHDADRLANLPDDMVPLLIDAAMAFGTGHHDTTRGCLIALDRLLMQGLEAASVADIGCGTAVLAMAAKRVWPDARVLASDIDEVAVETAQANLVFNDLAGQIECLGCPGFNHERLRRQGPFDLVFANILKAPLVQLAPDMAEHVAPGGHVILSGILNEQADEVTDAYEEHGFSPCDHDRLGEWTTLTMRKPR